MASSSKKTFATALAATPPMVPPCIKPQTTWEVFFMGELKRMQQEITHLKAELVSKEERIIKLEAHLQETENNKQQLQEIIREEVIKQHQDEAGKKEADIPPEVKSEIFANEVLSVMKEDARAKRLESYVRIGGLPDGWSTGTDPIEEIEGYILEVDILKERLTKVVPFVDLGDPIGIEVKGKQARVCYYDVDEKIKVMKQTRSLQGTSVWISDELTPLQLKNRARELAKVREARKQGKWAVYRGGKAIIKEFKNPTPPSKIH